MADGNTYLVAAARSPIGHFLGGLSKLPATAIGGQVARALLERAGVLPADVDEVLIGQVLQAGCGQNPARQVALAAGLPDTITAATINKVCGSSLQAAMFADQILRVGDAEVILAGGVESMSNAPHLVRGMRSGHKFGNVEMVDCMAYDGLTNVYDGEIMGVIAEESGRRVGATRAQQDEFSLRSHQRAAAAEKAGAFDAVRVPISVPRAAEPVARDETIRHDISIEKLAALKPAFSKDGEITAGNASTISDGAAMVICASAAGLKKCRSAPLARVVAHATAGGPPRDLFFAPIAACRKACEKAGWPLRSVDLWEINEAFAAQMLACMKGLELDPEKVNVHGGAIALGHPIGASGARVLGTLMHALKRLNLKRGVASLCLGGGNAVAMAIEAM
ncbi:MAG: acetyl-CoA C-acyltransferase [Planctomycetia bacterium]|nr:MAG: acetyl-CoA C-acyltransferase [Planctomycetia bacterium]